MRERTAELVAANEELQNEIALRKRLEGEIIGVSDREQRRLGQDLHDSLCQHLAATAFLARASGDRMRSGKRIDPGELDKISQLINDGVTEARTIARGLHPVEMDPAGLHTALHSLLSRQSQLPYRLDMDEELPISDPAVALHLYRIAREAVINANKHARAREILVALLGHFRSLLPRGDPCGRFFGLCVRAPNLRVRARNLRACMRERGVRTKTRRVRVVSTPPPAAYYINLNKMNISCGY